MKKVVCNFNIIICILCRKWPFDYKEEAVDILRHWLTCDVTKLTTEGLMDGFLGETNSLS